MPASPEGAPTGPSRRQALGLLGGTAAALALLTATGPAAQATPVAALPDLPDLPERVRTLLGKLTLDEKISLVHGAADPKHTGAAGYVPGVPRLGIPELRLTDGPAGVNLAKSATGLPPVSTLAASFNPRLAREYGAVMGREGRALGMDLMLAPQIELSRTPLFSRDKDQSGEDPYLNGVIGAAQVEGIQAQGMLAQAKHFLANNQVLGQTGDWTTGEGAYDFRVDDRTLHEIYLPAWETVVRAGVASVMAAYNHLNGPWNSDSRATLTGVLRGELGFEGFVTSDWGATHAVSIEAGLDMEMPDGSYFGDKLKAALADGSVPQAALDVAVGRVLGRYDALGLLDGSRVPAPSSVDVEAGAKVAREVAVQGAVLLANSGSLPLSRDALAGLALIGPSAAQVLVSAGGERAYGFEDRLVGPLDALKRTAGGAAKVRYAVGNDLTGTAVPASALPGGLSRAGSTDTTLDFTGDKALPTGSSHTWTGVLRPTTTGDHLLAVQGWGASLSLSLDGTELVTAAAPRDKFVRKWATVLPTTDGLDNGRTTIRLTAGRDYRIKVTAEGWAAGVAGRGPVQVRLAWVTPDQRAANVREAAALARSAHTPVVFAWNGSGGSIGSADDFTSLSLPNFQDDLIAAVAAANPRTIVVLNTGGPVAMPWRGAVGTVLHAGYVGQEGGWATADLLLGRADPGGRLVVTHPEKLTDHPVHDPAHPERYQGVDKVVTYSEGVFTGYRGFDKAGTEPLFPFGHGLSYTKFAYDKLEVRADGGGYAAAFTVTNTGDRAGADVPQVYLGPPAKSPVELPLRALVGFERVELKPGESRRVTVRITERQLSYWDAARGGWARTEGARPVYVGASSRDVRLTGSAG
ncbi:glycoside hydrolase family 3 C-terminal domain-containing protein [Streptomyces sp. AV19]|uniref:glycoside hydrolase family 3 protein n=1 Tax=Streptomyces sp. AV19 TaxID=2793068 RepID=UPI0018FE9262|nr:glycoside hydrolase family 3 C-terminal domain-containing protein [Streptomyces sp. AV19]MBH1936658.1 glycoside hydrolase family 3 C-terminal domain-containing protein [Streptomyces sp. AV19]MDG4532717.1 glycoside hydrolase family 3 C-terminal domain-containing protein [Streptomyces sp. AV19]